jgi:hypothetical protein
VGCVHFVPDFCGMSMRKANEILKEIKRTKRTQSATTGGLSDKTLRKNPARPVPGPGSGPGPQPQFQAPPGQEQPAQPDLTTTVSARTTIIRTINDVCGCSANILRLRINTHPYIANVPAPPIGPSFIFSTGRTCCCCCRCCCCDGQERRSCLWPRTV